MKNNRMLWVMTVCAALGAGVSSLPALAQVNMDASGLIFNRTSLKIIASGAIESPADSEDAAKKAPAESNDAGKKAPQKADAVADGEEAPTPAPVSLREISFSVDVRDHTAFDLEWIPSLNYVGAYDALLIVQPPATVVPFGKLRTTIPLDIVLVKPNGRISAILPSVSLGKLGSDVDAGDTIRGVLFLKSETVKKQGIQPGDEIKHPAFDPGPVIMK